MAMNLDELQKILDRDDANACLAFFNGCPETERRKCANLSAEFLKKEEGGRTAAIATTSACSFSELKKLGWRTWPRMEDAVEVMSDRKPKWLPEWIDWQLNDEIYWAPHVWGRVHAIVREGLAPKPEHPHYYLGMIGATSDWTHSGEEAEQRIYRMLIDDSDLLADVWKLFEFEGGGENSLANHDRFTHGAKWSTTFLKLAEEGHLSRERLLDESLTALERGFNHYRAKWFSSFHEELQPTQEERVARAGRYLNLLASPTPTIVAWALKRVQEMEKLLPYPAAELVEALLPVMRSRKKGEVIAGLKLLQLAVKRTTVVASQAAEVACEGLGHEAADVQAKVLDTLEKLTTTAERPPVDRVHAFRGSVAASLRQRVNSWLVANGSMADELPVHATAVADVVTEPAELLEEVRRLDPGLARLAGLGDLLEAGHARNALDDVTTNGLPPTSFNGTDIPRLDPARTLEPINNLDELIEVCSRVIEEPELIDEAFRALDGLSRLCDQRPDDFESRTGPLKKRVAKLLKERRFPFVGAGPSDDVCGAVEAWLCGTVRKPILVSREIVNKQVYVLPDLESHHFSRSDVERRPAGVLSRLAATIAERISVGETAPVLSAPTHSGGWIDPCVFVERANVWIAMKSEPPVIDVCLALLRLAADGRTESLERLAASKADWTRASRYALGGRATIGKSAPLWVAAARARTPFDDDSKLEAKHPQLGPGAGRVAQLSQRVAISHCRSKEEARYLRVDCEPPFPELPDEMLITVSLHEPLHNGDPDDPDYDYESRPVGGDQAATVTAARTLWPANLEGYFASGTGQIADNLDWWEAVWANRGYLDALLDPDVPLTPMANLLLALGLAAKEPGEHGLSIDIAIAAIEDGRLDVEQFGGQTAWLLTSGLIKTARWAKALAEVARVSPLHLIVVRQVVERTVTGEPDQMPCDPGKLLDLLFELSVEARTRIKSDSCREFLTRLQQSSKGKPARSAKKLLDLTSDEQKNQALLRDGFAFGLQSRIERVKRWTTLRQAGS